MTLQTIAYHHDGSDLRGKVALPPGGGRKPGVLVMSNAHGLGTQAPRQALLLAARGYVAVATDMYGGGACATDTPGTAALIGPLMQDPAKLRARVVAWYDVLAARADVDRQRIAAIGYCFGGQCVLELARSGADVKAVVSYHGLLTTTMPAKPDSIRAHVAVYTGAKDPYAPAAHVKAFRAEMAAANARYDITVFSEAYHAFTDPAANRSTVPGLKHDAVAERVSWSGTLALLETVL